MNKQGFERSVGLAVKKTKLSNWKIQQKSKLFGERCIYEDSVNLTSSLEVNCTFLHHHISKSRCTGGKWRVKYTMIVCIEYREAGESMCLDSLSNLLYRKVSSRILLLYCLLSVSVTIVYCYYTLSNPVVVNLLAWE